jgi:hypothetical protein
MGCSEGTAFKMHGGTNVVIADERQNQNNKTGTTEHQNDKT